MMNEIFTFRSEEPNALFSAYPFSVAGIDRKRGDLLSRKQEATFEYGTDSVGAGIENTGRIVEVGHAVVSADPHPSIQILCKTMYVVVRKSSIALHIREIHAVSR